MYRLIKHIQDQWCQPYGLQFIDCDWVYDVDHPLIDTKDMPMGQMDIQNGNNLH